MEWINPLSTSITFKLITNSLPMKGNLVYEYNPFRNYRLQDNKYYYQDNYYSLEELDQLFNITLSDDKKSWKGVPAAGSNPQLYEKGQLVDFTTDELSFSLEHPVHIVPQYSYDGSVNLILNDGINVPRLINSRFSATGKNTYEIIDRKGNNDTNIYDQGEQFDIDTSLYKRVVKIPKINFLKVQSGGNLKVGNYHFYFKFADADGNETDFVGESGLVSVFIGYGTASHTGTKNQNSFKSVRFNITDIDSSYNYIYVYYSRDFSELSDNMVTQYAKIEQKFVVNNMQECNVLITGYENVTELQPQDINLSYNIVDSAHCAVECQNMLFLANVHKPDIPYQELTNLSLRFLPYLKEESYKFDIDQNYSITSGSTGYYDPKFIYDHTGYWNKEIYRLGIVYILPNGELTPVFNIRGRDGIKVFQGSKQASEAEYIDQDGKELLDKNGNRYNFNNQQFWDGQYTYYNHFKRTDTGDIHSIPIDYNEQTNYLKPDENSIQIPDYDAQYENVKGVVSLDSSVDTNIIHAFDIRTDPQTIERLRGIVSGYFFVRQTRIPTILAQGITIGTDNYSHTPTIPTANGILSDIQDSLQYTHVETEDITGVNYISEGFLSRYSFSVKKKHSGLFGSILNVIKTVATVTAVIGTLAVSTLVFPPAAAVLGTLMGTVGISTSLFGAASIVVGTAVVGATAVSGLATAVVGAGQELTHSIQRSLHPKVSVNGRNTKIPSGYKKVENSESRQLTGGFIDRVIIKDQSSNTVSAIICPDYEINQSYYNQIFTGGVHKVRPTITQGINILTDLAINYFSNDRNHFYIPSYYDSLENAYYDCKIVAIADNVKMSGVDDYIFRSRAGEAEEAWRYECVGNDYKSDYSKYNSDEDSETQSNKRVNTDIVRGSYGPYLGITDFPNLPATTVDIMIPEYSRSLINEYFRIRMNDASSFYAISDRFDISQIDEKLQTSLSPISQSQRWDCGYQWELYRGDCYICQFTHRINRNFNDPSAPYNDEVVDQNTWKDNYDPNNSEKYEQINLGDVNAVQLGMWTTFRVRSSNNLNIRTIDESNVDEVAMSGHGRAYFPYEPMSTEGSYKIPESSIYNKGFSKSVGDRWNFELPDVPYIKNWFGTRIMYSDIHVNDAYKNGFRVFQGTHYRDYTRAYGEITKLIDINSNLLVIFEHGVAFIKVNGQANLANNSTNYITTNNVLDQDPIVISDMFGSQWPESILKVPGKAGDSAQYVYGVDTVAKKIWRTDGSTLTCISDFRVQEFLNKNITLGERELTPKIGIRNVKTVYNAFKRDVLFTFYDNTYGFEEKVWNLCWNELLQKFITFYSWVPSYMENINNIPFSFNRDTSKWIAKLGTSHTESSFADGVTLSNVLLENLENDKGEVVTNFRVPVSYINKQGEWKTINYTVADDEESRRKYIGVLSLSNRILPDSQLHYQVSYSLQRDQYGNYKKFEIVPLNCGEANGGIYLPDDAMFAGAFMPLYCLKFKQGGDEYRPIYYKEGQEPVEVSDGAGDTFYTYEALYTSDSLLSELYYRNSAGHAYADYDAHKLGTTVGGRLSYAPIEGDWEEVWCSDLDRLEVLESKYSPESLIGNSVPEGYPDNIKEGIPQNTPFPCTRVGEIRNIIRYDNQGTPMVHGIPLSWHWVVSEATPISGSKNVYLDLPIFKDITGKRPNLPRENMINPDKIVTLLNIKATISIVDSDNNSKLSDAYYNMKAGFQQGTSLVDAGYYESVVAITPKWNLQFLSTDFWKHGQAGLIDIADDIYPTYWYGKQHPFEFECVIVNDPSMHKIFTNLEIVANKAKPESFHYEIIGESYDFAKDKVNMYFRQEAMKALWQYNGADISYDRNFLKVQPRQQPKSADFPHKYYTRQDTINEIEDYYIHVTYPESHDYRHLSGAEVVYYPNRQEYRIWNHAMAVSLDDLSQDDSRSIIAANCQYLEDRWKVTINPILVCYKNEYQNKFSGPLIQPKNSTWPQARNSSQLLPPFSIYNSPIPDQVLAAGAIDFPGNDLVHPEWGQDNALYNLYDLSRYGNGSWSPLDLTNWLDDVNIYKYNFGEAQNRKELDVKDKFLKVRIRYSGEELAIIDFLNTVYRISYS